MRTRFLTLLLATTLAACGDDTTGPVAPLPDTTAPAPAEPVALPLLGVGPVLERWTGEVAVAGNVAYTTTWGGYNLRVPGAVGNALKIWDVSGATPALVDSVIISDARTLGDVQISTDGGLLVVATEYTPGSIVIFDRSDPTKPVQLSRFSSQATGPGVHTVKLARVAGRHYAFLSIFGPSRLVVVDITDPTKPQEVYAQSIGSSYLHDVFVRDGLLFTALWAEGMTIWDIGGGGKGGSPANPVRIGSLVTKHGSAHNLWWYHDAAGGKRYVFVGEEGPGVVGSSSSGDIHVVDISDPSQPKEVAFYHLDKAGTHNFSVDEARGILYAAYYNGGVRALNVTGDLSACTAAQRAADGRCDLGLMKREIGYGPKAGTVLPGGAAYVWGVQHQGTRLYASDMTNGLLVFDVSALKP